MYSKTPTHNNDDNWNDEPNKQNNQNYFDRNKSPRTNRFNNVSLEN